MGEPAGGAAYHRLLGGIPLVSSDSEVDRADNCMQILPCRGRRGSANNDRFLACSSAMDLASTAASGSIAITIRPQFRHPDCGKTVFMARAAVS